MDCKDGSGASYKEPTGTGDPSLSAVWKCEERLRRAMLEGDVAALSDLLDDRLVFTGPDGSVLSKAQDLHAQQSRLLKLSRIEFQESRLHRLENMVLSTTKASLIGTYADRKIEGLFAYTRLWTDSSGKWHVVAGHASVIG